jgi:hypothetical protein
LVKLKDSLSNFQVCLIFMLLLRYQMWFIMVRIEA